MDFLQRIGLGCILLKALLAIHALRSYFLSILCQYSNEVGCCIKTVFCTFSLYHNQGQIYELRKEGAVRNRGSGMEVSHLCLGRCPAKRGDALVRDLERKYFFASAFIKILHEHFVFGLSDVSVFASVIIY